jgi:hypothetical protein
MLPILLIAAAGMLVPPISLALLDRQARRQS